MPFHIWRHLYNPIIAMALTWKTLKNESEKLVLSDKPNKELTCLHKVKFSNCTSTSSFNKNVCYHSQLPQLPNYSYTEKSWFTIINLLIKYEVVKMTCTIQETMPNVSFQLPKSNISSKGNSLAVSWHNKVWLTTFPEAIYLSTRLQPDALPHVMGQVTSN